MPNNTIKTLTKQLHRTYGKIDNLKSEIQQEYNKIFEVDESLNNAINELYTSEDYGRDEYDEIYKWLRFDTKPYTNCKEYLEEYLAEYAMSVDFYNDAILLYFGPEEIIINSDGDIFLGHECIIESKEYDTTEERNKLIEEYMETTGYYPGVFYCDYYGNITSINTQSKQRD